MPVLKVGCCFYHFFRCDQVLQSHQLVMVVVVGGGGGWEGSDGIT